MEQNYLDKAKQLSEQKKVRMRVMRRRRIASGLTASVLVVALSVGMGALFIKAWDKEQQINDQMIADYRSQISAAYDLKDSDMAQAKIDFVEAFYSADTIEQLKISVLNEYGLLIDSIVENEAMKEKINTSSLDNKRLDKTIAKYGSFKKDVEQDKVDYTNATESTRMNAANSLHGEKLSVLKAQLDELDARRDTFSDAAEYNRYLEERVIVERKINDSKEALNEIGEKVLLIHLQKNEEEGKNK